MARIAPAMAAGDRSVCLSGARLETHVGMMVHTATRDCFLRDN
jgi:hypothetical protein